MGTEATRENTSEYAGNQGGEELLKAACPKAQVLASAVMQHHHAEACMSNGDPRSACAAAEAGLRQLDHCLPHTQVSYSPSSKPAAIGMMLASHINPAPRQLHAFAVRYWLAPFTVAAAQMRQYCGRDLS